jgi:DNA polymerase III alpha subunit (gram-positive type)
MKELEKEINGLLQQDRSGTLEERHARRTLLKQKQQQLQQEVYALTQHIDNLPTLPALSLVWWAQAVLALPNLRFVVLDTTSVAQNSDILRILIIDVQGEKVFHEIVKPGRWKLSPNTHYTGILQEVIDQAPTLKQVWSALQDALKGAFILAYGLNFVHERLDENAEYLGLSPVSLVGECLMQTASQYWSQQRSIKLADAMTRIGYPTATTPIMALQRALGQIALLKAMAEGVVEKPAPYLEDDLGDLEDDHPF